VALGANRWWSNRELTQQFGDGQQQVAAASVTIVTALGVDTVQMSHATGKIWFRFEVVFMEKCFIARPDTRGEMVTPATRYRALSARKDSLRPQRQTAVASLKGPVNGVGSAAAVPHLVEAGLVQQ